MNGYDSFSDAELDGEETTEDFLDNSRPNVTLWDARSGNVVRTMRAKHWVNSLVFSPNGAMLAVGCQNGKVQLLDARTGKELRNMVLQGACTSVGYSPDGEVLAAGSRHGKVRLWESRAGLHLRTLDLQGVCTDVQFSPDGTLLATGCSDGNIKLWDARTGSELRTLRGHVFGIVNVRFSPDGSALASGCEGGMVKLWNTRPEKEYRTLRGHPFLVNSVAFSPDGSCLASGCANGTLKLWDARSGLERRTLRGHLNGVASVVFSPDGAMLASGSFDQTVRLWEVRTGRLLRTLRLEDIFQEGFLNSPWASREGRDEIKVSFSADGTVLASLSPQKVMLWDMKTDREIRTLLGGTSLAFSPDGAVLAVAHLDRSVKLWDVRNGTEIRNLGKYPALVYSMAFSPDGTVLAFGCHGMVKLWNMQTSQELRTLELGKMGSIFTITSIALSSDGKVLAALFEGEGKLWDLRTGQELRTLKIGKAVNDSQFSSVGFSPDGTVLVSLFNGDVKLWDARSELGRTLPGGFGAIGWKEDQGHAPRHPSPSELRFRLMWSQPDPEEHKYRAQEAEKAKDDFAAACQVGNFLSARVRLERSPWDPAGAVCLLGNAFTQVNGLTGYFGLEEGRRARTAFVDGATFAGILLQDSGRSPQGMVVRARWAVDQRPEGWKNREVLGAALYRAGEFKAAVQELLLAHKLQGQVEKVAPSTFSCRFLALAHHRLGNRAEAENWHAKSVLPKDAPWEDALIDRFLRREVEAVLSGPSRSDPR